MKFEKEEKGRVHFSITKKELRSIVDMVTLYQVKEIMKKEDVPSSFKALLTHLCGLGSNENT